MTAVHHWNRPDVLKALPMGALLLTLSACTAELAMSDAGSGAVDAGARIADGDGSTSSPDGAIVTDAGPDRDAAGEPAWTDPTLTTDADTRARALAYEAQAWAVRDDLTFHIEYQYGDGRVADARARELTYSSGYGLAIYHLMDEIIAVTQLMEVTDDDTHRDFYAELLAATLDELVPAIEEGRGTEGCTRSGSLFQCSPGYLRYLDAGHGAGGAGFVMNAFFENPVLRARYASDLERWAAMLESTLERHFSIVGWSDMRFPHMPAKIAAGYLALGKILEASDPERAARYSEAFADIIRFMAASAEANGGWIGADVSHARISAAVMHLAYREEARGVLPAILTSAHLAGVGDGFEDARTERGAFEFEGSLVGHHGVLVRHSSGIESIVDDTYVMDPARRGSHVWARPFETLSALAIGHVTLLEP